MELVGESESILTSHQKLEQEMPWFVVAVHQYRQKDHLLNHSHSQLHLLPHSSRYSTTTLVNYTTFCLCVCVSALFKQALTFQWLNFEQFALFKQRTNFPNYGIAIATTISCMVLMANAN